MRRLVVAGTSLFLLAALGVFVVGTAISASKRPDLAVSDLAEPPQAGAAGSSFRQTFTVANQGNRNAGKRTRTSIFLDQNPNNSAGRTRVGRPSVGTIPGKGELTRRVTLNIPAGLANGSYFIVACADTGKKLREARERNNCRVSAQALAVGGALQGPQGPPGENDETVVKRTIVPLGRATLDNGSFTEDEFSTERRELANIGHVRLVADCKRVTNGDSASPDTAPDEDNGFDGGGDEAKLLVYTDTGNVTFTSVGNSSRRNIPAGEGEPYDNTETGQTDEVTGGEGKHMAIAARRDPAETEPAFNFVYGYHVGTVYINHSNGTELIFTGYTGIDIAGAGDNCVFGGLIKRVKVVN